MTHSQKHILKWQDHTKTPPADTQTREPYILGLSKTIGATSIMKKRRKRCNSKVSRRFKTPPVSNKKGLRAASGIVAEVFYGTGLIRQRFMCFDWIRWHVWGLSGPRSLFLSWNRWAIELSLEKQASVHFKKFLLKLWNSDSWIQFNFPIWFWVVIFNSCLRLLHLTQIQGIDQTGIWHW
jgi:hypothetical protein